MSKRLHQWREKGHVMRRCQVIVIAAALVMLFAAGCATNGSENAGADQSQSGAGSGIPQDLPQGGAGSSSSRDLPQGSERVDLDPKDFTTRIDNPYWPMDPGTRWTYRETDKGAPS
jgi:hypothetical protein